MRKSIWIGLLFALSVVAIAFGVEQPKSATKKAEGQTFYVYSDANSRLNHFIPSGYMGDYGDIYMNQRSSETVARGLTAIKIKYTADRRQEAGWCGVYWQSPANNWGNMKGGYDLTGFKKLVFMARGQKGGEFIDKFFFGGITGQTEEGDSDTNYTDSIELTNKWQEYVIPLDKLDMSHIIGGFGWAINAEMNPQGATFYIDEIRYEK